MPLPLFYIEQLDPQSDLHKLNEENSRHLIQVLRMQPKDLIQLTDGNGNIVTAEIMDANKKSCLVKQLSIEKQPKEKKHISIAISLIKNTSRFEWFLEKANEIGVSEIIPLQCERTEKQQFRFDRMKGILISAMLQSRQCRLPKLHQPIALNQFVLSSTSDCKWIAHCEEDSTKQMIPLVNEAASSTLLIGPEGDFTHKEILFAISNGFIPVSLGSNRLRTETAGVVGAVLLNLG